MHQYKDIDLYAIMGINISASKKEIKAAYRQLARKYHPDVNKGNKLSEKKFKEVTEAYDVLTDDLKRKQYDLIRGIVQARSSASKQQETQAKTAYTKQKESKTEEPQPRPKSEESKDKSFGDVFSEFLDGVFKKNEPAYQYEKSKPKPTPEPRKKPPDPVNGEDITVDLSITIQEANMGTVRTVNVIHTEPCRGCQGKRIINGAKCRVCGGNGEIINHKKINVKIPPNVKEGSRVRIPNEGNKGINSGKSGDLFLKIQIERSEFFKYDNLNVLLDLPITPSEAALGVNIQIPTIDGSVSMKIPPETSSEQKFKLAGLGLSDPEGKNKGDHIVTVYIKMPQNLTKEEKELYEKLSKLRDFSPRDVFINETTKK